MSMKSKIFEVKSLNFKVANQEILTDITFDISTGEYVAIIGPNGGGKTTLARLMLGLERPTSGDIKIFSKDIKDFNKWHKIGYVPQRASLVDTAFPATVLDIVQMGQIRQKKDKDAIDDALKKMDIYDLKNRLIGELSGGQRQRAMIARALAQKPQVLILDEPNTGVDKANQINFYKLLAKLNKQDGVCIVFITHDVGVIADDIDRLFTINQKAIICNDPKKEITCDDMSKLYGIDAHLIHNHRHEH